MGQLIFVGPSGAGSDGRARVVYDLYSADENLAFYGSLTEGATFFGDPLVGFTHVLVLRQVLESSNTVDVFAIEDSAAPDPTGFKFRMGGTTDVRCQAYSGGVTDNAIAAGLPTLGRLVVLAATYSPDNTAFQFYVNGQLMDQAVVTWAAADGNVSVIVGASESWISDTFEYLGYGFVNAQLTSEQMAEVYVATQDAVRLTFPSSVQAAGTYAIYNADTLSNINVWSPDPGSTIADTLPLVSTLIEETGPYVKAVPAHWMYSGSLTPAA